MDKDQIHLVGQAAYNAAVDELRRQVMTDRTPTPLPNVEPDETTEPIEHVELPDPPPAKPEPPEILLCANGERFGFGPPALLRSICDEHPERVRPIVIVYEQNVRHTASAERPWATVGQRKIDAYSEDVEDYWRHFLGADQVSPSIRMDWFFRDEKTRLAPLMDLGPIDVIIDIETWMLGLGNANKWYDPAEQNRERRIERMVLDHLHYMHEFAIHLLESAKRTGFPLGRLYWYGIPRGRDARLPDGSDPFNEIANQLKDIQPSQAIYPPSGGFVRDELESRVHDIIARTNVTRDRSFTLMPRRAINYSMLYSLLFMPYAPKSLILWDSTGRTDWQGKSVRKIVEATG